MKLLAADKRRWFYIERKREKVSSLREINPKEIKKYGNKWTKKLVWQNVENVIKRFIIRRG